MKSPYNIPNTNFKNAKVLIVEDSDDQWLIMQQVMRQCISEVTAQRVATIEEALMFLQEWRYQEWEIPKLILLDLYLPNNSDGRQLLKQIRAMSTPISQIPIVMLTSSKDRTDIEEAYQLGISAYMVKPVEFADWLTFFRQLRIYWWETVTLPPTQYKF